MINKVFWCWFGFKGQNLFFHTEIELSEDLKSQCDYFPIFWHLSIPKPTHNFNSVLKNIKFSKKI